MWKHKLPKINKNHVKIKKKKKFHSHSEEFRKST